MKNSWFFGLLLCLAFSYVKAQEGCNLQLSGKIIDEHDGSTLAFSTVYLLNEKRGVAADENGNFVLQNLCPKEYQLVISHIGCEPDTVVVKLKKSQSFTFKLEHHLEELQEVQIQGERESVNQEEKLSQSDFYAKGGKPIGEILSEINGVSTFKTGANISKPVISGFKNNRVQLINQGVQLQSQQWGDEHAPEIDPFSASVYSVIKGAGAVKYAGGAIGGFVIANPKTLPTVNGVHGELNSLYASNNRMGNVSLMLEGNSKLLPDFSWRIQGSGKRSGNIKTPNYYQKNTGVKELNGSADLGYYKEKWNARIFYSQFNSEIGIFSGAHIGNLTDLQAAINRSEPRVEDREGFSYDIRRPKQRIIHELIKTELNYYTTAGKFNVKLARQFNVREEFDKELPRNRELAALNIPEFSLSLESYSANLNWTLPELGRWKSELGIQLVDQRNSVNSFTDFIPDYTQTTLSAYWVEQWEKEKLSFEFGARFDYQMLEVDKLINRSFKQYSHDFNGITANAGVGYKLSRTQFLKSNFVFVQRPPAVNELYSDGLHHGSASLEFGNANLGAEKSYGFNLSYELKKKQLNYELYAYLQYIEDFIYLRPDGLDLTIRGAFPSYQWSNTNALIRGLDQQISYQISSKVRVENKLSLLWGNNETMDNFLINMPSNRIESNVNYTLEIGKKHSKLNVKLGNQMVFKQRRFNEEEEFAEPPKGYHLFFANVTYGFELNKKQSLEFAIRVDNILDTVYRDYLNRFRFFTDEQGRNITFRIKYNF